MKGKDKSIGENPAPKNGSLTSVHSSIRGREVSGLIPVDWPMKVTVTYTAQAVGKRGRGGMGQETPPKHRLCYS